MEKEGDVALEEKAIGRVTHYFSKLGVAVVELDEALEVGDQIHVKGHTSDFTQTIDSMQIEHESVEAAQPGQSIGLKVADHVREHDVVYKVLTG